MPFFSHFTSKFSPKKAQKDVATDLEDLVLGQRSVKIKLGTQNLVFENGEWVPDSGKSGSIHRSNQKLKKQILELQEENNMLRLKYNLVVNMLTQTTAESHLLEKELEDLRKAQED